jgi:hypothetical protein
MNQVQYEDSQPARKDSRSARPSLLIPRVRAASRSSTATRDGTLHHACTALCRAIVRVCGRRSEQTQRRGRGVDRSTDSVTTRGIAGESSGLAGLAQRQNVVAGRRGELELASGQTGGDPCAPRARHKVKTRVPRVPPTTRPGQPERGNGGGRGVGALLEAETER